MSTTRLCPATTYPAVVGQVLARLRSTAGLEQAELAGHVGVSQSTWSRIERGASAFTIEQLALVAKSLGTEPSIILRQADRAARELAGRGIRVEPRRINVAIELDLVLIDVAALAGLIAMALDAD